MQLNEIKVGGLYGIQALAKLRDEHEEMIELIVYVSGKTQSGLLEVEFPPLRSMYYVNPGDLFPLS
jgi:hypothetical protein